MFIATPGKNSNSNPKASAIGMAARAMATVMRKPESSFGNSPVMSTMVWAK